MGMTQRFQQHRTVWDVAVYPHERAALVHLMLHCIMQAIQHTFVAHLEQIGRWIMLPADLLHHCRQQRHKSVQLTKHEPLQTLEAPASLDR